ncbi:hypothetical protein [Cetobacterium sp. ZOR0034]|uniref:hypothetical protein n=1 Tax=Cetobacterium sp. ZOR0034 TaxID=1339239 RepID=UPI000645E3A3|nr:hypothetical protein [Cetobacterium sp. ZOR0034]
MRTREQELEFQVRDIFNEFYKEKMINEVTTSFILDEDDLSGMLNVEIKENDKGNFFHDELEDNIFYKFIRRKEKNILMFLKSENGGCS